MGRVAGFENGGDRVLIAHSTANGWSAAHSVDPRRSGRFSNCCRRGFARRVWVVWSQREGETWNLVARNYDGRNWSASSQADQR